MANNDKNISTPASIQSTSYISCTPIIFDPKTGKRRYLHDLTPVPPTHTATNKRRYLHDQTPIPPTHTSTNNLLDDSESVNKPETKMSILTNSFITRNSIASQFVAGEDGQTIETPHRDQNLRANVTASNWSLASVKRNSFVNPELQNSVNSISLEKIVNYVTQSNCDNHAPIEWDNPVLGVNTITAIPSIANYGARAKRKKLEQVCHTVSFTKDLLHSIDVIGQVDDRFIACVLTAQSLLVLIDQHAAHERIRLENLLEQIGYYNDSSKLSKTCRTRLNPPAQISFYENELELIMRYKSEFADIGLQLSTSNSKPRSGKQKIYVSCVPSIFVDVSAARLEAKGTTVNHELVKEFINEQIVIMQTINGTCNMSSTVMFKVLASYACHGAIKFGDALTLDTCVQLISELATCNLPFQCAHGRPSIVPVLKLEMMQQTHSSKSSNLKLTNLRHLKTLFHRNLKNV